MKFASLSQDFLNTLIQEQLPFGPSTVFCYWITPFIIEMIVVQMRGYYFFSDATRQSNVLDGDYCLLTLQVMLFTYGRPIIQIVPSIRPEPSFEDMVGIDCRLLAEYAFMSITLKYRFSELLPRQKGLH